MPLPSAVWPEDWRLHCKTAPFLYFVREHKANHTFPGRFINSLRDSEAESHQSRRTDSLVRNYLDFIFKLGPAAWATTVELLLQILPSMHPTWESVTCSS